MSAVNKRFGAFHHTAYAVWEHRNPGLCARQRCCQLRTSVHAPHCLVPRLPLRPMCRRDGLSSLIKVPGEQGHQTLNVPGSGMARREGTADSSHALSPGVLTSSRKSHSTGQNSQREVFVQNTFAVWSVNKPCSQVLHQWPDTEQCQRDKVRELSVLEWARGSVVVHFCSAS